MPLPTKWIVPRLSPLGRHVSRTIRGSSVDPALTPSIPPHRSSIRRSRSHTSTSRPDCSATLTASSANWTAESDPPGRFTRSRVRAMALATASALERAAALSTPSGTTSVTCWSEERSSGLPFSSSYRYEARSIPSTVAWSATSAPISVAVVSGNSEVMESRCLEALHKDAAALRTEGSVISCPPSPTAITIGSCSGSSTVWPSFPSNPLAARKFWVTPSVSSSFSLIGRSVAAEASSAPATTTLIAEISSWFAMVFLSCGVLLRVFAVDRFVFLPPGQGP